MSDYINQLHSSFYTLAFSGTVSQDPLFDPDDPFGGTIGFGTPLTGTYTFESGTPDADPSASGGSYTSASSTLTINIGGNTFIATDLLNIGVGNDFASSDFYTVFAQNTSGPDPFELSLIFQDTDGTVLGTDALPTSAPLFGAFELATLILDGTVAGNQVQISADLAALSCVSGCAATPVPEPGTLMLLGVGLAGLGLWRRVGVSSIAGTDHEQPTIR